VTILSDKELNQGDFQAIKKEIEEKINQPIELELALGVRVLQ
jgi:hypothetical protein